MNQVPSDDDFRQAYAVFDDDHAALRDQFVSLLPAGGVVYPLPRRPARRGVWLALGVCACLALAVGTWLAFFTVGVAPRPAYALEGIHDRLLAVRSLHIKGWTYHSIEVDGKEVREKYPVERYVERPSREWHSWISFEYPGRQLHLRSGFSATDGSRALYVSDTDKEWTPTERDPFATELWIESTLQQQWARELIRGPTSEHRLAGTENLGGRQTLKYEYTRSGGRSRCLLWLNPTTGLPVRCAAFDIGADGAEQPSLEYDQIEFDVRPRPAMFSFVPPVGYSIKPPEAPPPNPFVDGAGSQAMDDRVAVRPILAVDSLAVLVCWRHSHKRADGVWSDPDVLVVPEIELIGTSTRRDCDLVPLKTQPDGDEAWRWGLILPRDRRPLDPGEVLNFKFAFPSGSSASGFGGTPLRLDDERLSKILARMQEQPSPAVMQERPSVAEGTSSGVKRGMPPARGVAPGKPPAGPSIGLAGPDEGPLTLFRLRWQVARILKQSQGDDVDAPESGASQNKGAPLPGAFPKEASSTGAKRRTLPSAERLVEPTPLRERKDR
jgi:hypothetical protein